MIPESSIDPADVLEMAFGVRPSVYELSDRTWGAYHLHPDGWYRLYPPTLGLLGVAIAMTPE